MKRVSEIKEELKELANKKEKLEIELSEVAKELKKQYPIVYGLYKDQDIDVWYPDFIFTSRKAASEYEFKGNKNICALASEELSDQQIYNLIKD